MTHQPDTVFQRLRAFDDFFEPVHRTIVEWVHPATGAKVADIGCGAGGMALLFADAVGEQGQVAAVEPEPERLTALRDYFGTMPAYPRISLHQGELPALPFEDDEFDLTWCSRVIHHLGDQVAGIRELKRIAKLGGRVVVREGGINARFLPYDVGIGEPGIQDRMCVAQNLRFDKMRAGFQDNVPYPHGWLAALRDAGLEHVTAKSFLYELIPPFSDAQCAYFRGWLNDYATDTELALTDADRDALRRLSDPASPGDAFRRDDLHLLYVDSIYIGEK